MTVHAAKGLDSRVVFFAAMDEGGRRQDILAIREDQAKVHMTFTDSVFKENPEKLLWEAKKQEEQKRLFYVVCTRARDGLFLSGVWQQKASGWLSYLVQAAGLRQNEAADGNNYLELSDVPQGVKLQVRKHIEPGERSQVEQAKKTQTPTVILERNWAVREGEIRRASEYDNAEEEYYQSQGLRYFGEIMHSVLERISNASIRCTPDDISQAVRALVYSFDLAPSQIPKYQQRALNQIDNLESSGLLESVILPRQDSFSEVPFVFREGFKTYTGRIDRVLLKQEGIHIIDYKSFPSNLANVFQYTEQLKIYARAAFLLYKKNVSACFLLFTADAKLVPVDIAETLKPDLR
jgi:ATP-dependent exoDNAse (exonuclease V) beta subunit